MDDIEKIITNMTMNEGMALQRELQYAVAWHDEGYAKAEASIFCNSSQINRDLNGESDGAWKGKEYHMQRRTEIKSSKLYKLAVSEVIKKIPNSPNLPCNWAGWIGLLSENEPKQIRKLIGTIFTNKYPIYGQTGGGVTIEEANNAKESLKKNHYLMGVFLGKEPIEKVFIEHYRKSQ